MNGDFSEIGHLEDVDVSPQGKINIPQANGKPLLIMIWGSYCGHCNKAKPAFYQAYKQHRQQKVFFAALQTDDRDPNVQKLMKRIPAILQSKGIEFRGVPMYVLVSPDGRMKEYTGGRDTLSIIEMVNSI